MPTDTPARSCWERATATGDATAMYNLGVLVEDEDPAAPARGSSGPPAIPTRCTTSACWSKTSIVAHRLGRYRCDMETSGGVPATPAADVIRPLRTVIVAACAVIILFGVVAVAFTSGARGLTVPTTIQLTVVIVATCGSTIFIGRSIQPLPVDGNAARGFAVLRSLTFLRVGTAGSCALLGLALSVSADNATPYLIAGPIALILQLGVANPHRATLRALQKRLEANGADSGLTTLIR